MTFHSKVTHVTILERNFRHLFEYKRLIKSQLTGETKTYLLPFSNLLWCYKRAVGVHTEALALWFLVSSSTS